MADRKNLVIAFIVGMAMGGAADLAMGFLDHRGQERGALPMPWSTPVAVACCVGMAAFSLTWVLTTNKKLALAGPDEERRAKAFAPDPQRGTLYVFRDASVSRFAGIDILIDGATAGQTRGMTFLRVELAPGDHVVSSVNPFDKTRVDLPVSLAAADIVYIEHGIPVVWRTSTKLSVVNAAKSQRRIRRCRMLALDQGARALILTRGDA